MCHLTIISVQFVIKAAVEVIADGSCTTHPTQCLMGSDAMLHA